MLGDDFFFSRNTHKLTLARIYRSYYQISRSEAIIYSFNF